MLACKHNRSVSKVAETLKCERKTMRSMWTAVSDLDYYDQFNPEPPEEEPEPLPDSPTMPSVLPVSTVNETPRTAFTAPSAVEKLTRRSDTSSRLNACLRIGLCAHLASGRAPTLPL